MKKVFFDLKLYSAFPGSWPCYREPPHTRNSWWLAKLTLTETQMDMAKIALWWSSLVSCPKTDQQFHLYSWKSQHFISHCQERNAACFSSPKFSCSCAMTSRTLQSLGSPGPVCLPLPPPLTRRLRVTLDYLYKSSSFGKPGLVCLSLATNYQT